MSAVLQAARLDIARVELSVQERIVIPAKAGIHNKLTQQWIPACAGMTDSSNPCLVIPVKAGISFHGLMSLLREIPACAGMTWNTAE